MNQQDQSLPVLQLAAVTKEDIDQEAALLRLQGITPNKRIIRSRLLGQSRHLLYNTAPEDATPLAYLVQTPTASDEAIERLIDWTLQQVAPVQEMLWRFITNPETELEATLVFLQEHQLASTTRTPSTAVSISQILRDALPATKEELYTLVRALSPETERPEATVRQWLRRNLAKGALHVKEDNTIHPH